jgi:hypothetical protein
MTLNNVLLAVMSVAVLVLTSYCLFCPESGYSIWKQSPDACSNPNCTCDKCACGKDCACGCVPEIKAYMGHYNKETGEWEFKEVPLNEAPQELFKPLPEEEEKELLDPPGTEDAPRPYIGPKA